MNDASQGIRVPKLRFPDFQGEWKAGTIRQFLQKVVKPVEVKPELQYWQIGVRSHGKGLFHKEPVFGSELGEKRVFWVQPNVLVINIVFAWEQALAITTDSEEGMVASHRFPMFSPIKEKSHLHFMFHFFMRKQGKSLLALASPGGAGRNKTLGQSEFTKLKVLLPDADEQKKIAAFLGAMDAKLAHLESKKRALNRYKAGVMQKLFSQTIRFTRESGQKFPDWNTSKLGDFVSFSKGKGISKSDISASGKTPCIRYGELYTLYREVIDDVASSTNEPIQNLVLSISNDVIIPASGEDPLDIARAACVTASGIAIGGDINILRGSFDGAFIAYYLNHARRRAIARLAQGNSVVHLYGTQLKTLSVHIPCIEEQQKISTALSSIDKKIEAVQNQVEATTKFKNSLVQRMFV
jgi:type I restriction enzyme S subunit